MEEECGSQTCRVPRDRCPECEMAFLNTPIILIRRTKRTTMSLPLKACRHCKIIIVKGGKRMNEWKIWNAGEYLQLD